MAFDYKEIVPYLLHWFEYNARILPWREKPIPYYVWISEIMLQQTRVEAVKGYFDRFITALPDIETLATVEEEKLLKLWQGLGYYNRVRNLQKAAQQIMTEYEGKVPADYDILTKLPGIGTYTAGAIASIAYQIPVPAIDGNVLRVTKRIAGSFDDITKDKTKKELWSDLSRIMPENRPGDFNQSLMELGAMICLPSGRPLCQQCPVMHLCKAFHEETVLQIPVKPAKKERRKENHTILFMEYQDRYAIRKREKSGLLAGLWELPNLEGRITKKDLEQQLREGGMKSFHISSLGEAKHIFTHVEWHMIGYHIKINDEKLNIADSIKGVWVKKKDINELYSIPSAFAPYMKVLEE